MSEDDWERHVRIAWDDCRPRAADREPAPQEFRDYVRRLMERRILLPTPEAVRVGWEMWQAGKSERKSALPEAPADGNRLRSAENILAGLRVRLRGEWPAIILLLDAHEKKYGPAKHGGSTTAPAPPTRPYCPACDPRVPGSPYHVRGCPELAGIDMGGCDECGHTGVVTTAVGGVTLSQPCRCLEKLR